MVEIILLVIILFGIAFATQRGNDKRLRKLEEDVVRLTADLASARAMAASPPAAVAVVPEAAEVPVAETTAIPDDPVPAAAGTMPADAAAVMSQTAETAGDPALAERPAAGTAAPRDRESLESWLGARWAVWVGGLALALGGIFLVKYSIDSGLLSPAVRLAMATAFGLALFAAGDVIRRRGMPRAPEAFGNAMIPGILTAAGAVTVFGAIYAAHGVYGFIGPTAAFLLLSVVALATLALSLMHGQALAGLGLLGSMLTPALISSTAPNIWALFGFLTVSWLATAAASRLRRWTIVPSLGNVGIGGWAIVYMANASVLDLTPVTLSILAMIAGVLFLWPGRLFRQDGAAATMTPAASDTPEPAAGTPRAAGWTPGPWERLFARQPAAITVTAGFASMLPALMMAATPLPSTIDPALGFTAIIAALAAYAAARVNTAITAIVAAIGALVGTMMLAVGSIYPEALGITAEAVTAPLSYRTEIAVSLGLGALFVGLGMTFLGRHGRAEKQFSALWCALMVIVPVVNALVSLINFGNLDRDWLHGAYGVALALAYLGGAEWLTRRGDPEGRSAPVGWLVSGAFAGLFFALNCITHGIYAVVGVAVLGFAFVAATRVRRWAILPWMMAAAAVLVLLRIAGDPTIVGADTLGTRPVFNALAVGYGVPALLTALAAFELRAWPGLRIRNMLQALASLMVFLTIAILVRHGMNGGTLAGDAPTLGEQSIYTLLTIGASAVLMTLDLRSPSPVFRYGAMTAGVLSMLSVLGAHLLALNPYFTWEDTGSLPFLNLLLAGYLLPGIGYAGLALYARNRRPKPYVILLALCGALLGFAYATLSVRRFWQGRDIADWKGFLQGETYTYSVVWLAIGVALLGLGSRLDARSLRLASAALVLIAVIKVFLIDMANLEGFLRALSFIGLGAVLICIGLFYQRILTSKAAQPVQSDKA